MRSSAACVGPGAIFDALSPRQPGPSHQRSWQHRPSQSHILSLAHVDFWLQEIAAFVVLSAEEDFDPSLAQETAQTLTQVHQKLTTFEEAQREQERQAAIAAIPIAASDVKIEVSRSRGYGGQHINRVDTTIRLTHLPTGTVVCKGEERSSYKNRAAAFQQLRECLYEAQSGPSCEAPPPKTSLTSAIEMLTQASHAQAHTNPAPPKTQNKGEPRKEPPRVSAPPNEEREEHPVNPEESGFLQRKACVHYYEQMSPHKVFPMVVSIVKESAAPPAPQHEGVTQAESAPVSLKATSPTLTIVPVIPGCLVSPSTCTVEVNAAKVDAHFWLTPLVTEAHIDAAEVQLWHESKLLSTIQLPTRIRRQRLSKLSLACSLVGALLNGWENARQVLQPDSTGTTSLGEWLVDLLPGLTSTGCWLILFFLLLSLGLYMQARPRQVLRQQDCF